MFKKYSINRLLSLFFIGLLIGLLYPINIVDHRVLYYDQLFLGYLEKNCTKKRYMTPIQKIIKIEPMGVEYIGICYTNHITRINIIYNEVFWDRLTEDQRYSTAMHENMHCYFGIDHIDDPNHFMYKYENDVPKIVVYEQLIDLLRKLCN